MATTAPHLLQNGVVPNNRFVVTEDQVWLQPRATQPQLQPQLQPRGTPTVLKPAGQTAFAPALQIVQQPQNNFSMHQPGQISASTVQSLLNAQNNAAALQMLSNNAAMRNIPPAYTSSLPTNSLHVQNNATAMEASRLANLQAQLRLLQQQQNANLVANSNPLLQAASVKPNQVNPQMLGQSRPGGIQVAPQNPNTPAAIAAAVQRFNATRTPAQKLQANLSAAQQNMNILAAQRAAAGLRPAYTAVPGAAQQLDTGVHMLQAQQAAERRAYLAQLMQMNGFSTQSTNDILNDPNKFMALQKQLQQAAVQQQQQQQQAALTKRLQQQQAALRIQQAQEGLVQALKQQQQLQQQHLQQHHQQMQLQRQAAAVSAAMAPLQAAQPHVNGMTANEVNALLGLARAQQVQRMQAAQAAQATNATANFEAVLAAQQAALRRSPDIGQDPAVAFNAKLPALAGVVGAPGQNHGAAAELNALAANIMAGVASAAAPATPVISPLMSPAAQQAAAVAAAVNGAKPAASQDDFKAILAYVGANFARMNITIDQAVNAGLLGGLGASDVTILMNAYNSELERVKNGAAGAPAADDVAAAAPQEAATAATSPTAAAAAASETGSKAGSEMGSAAGDVVPPLDGNGFEVRVDNAEVDDELFALRSDSADAALFEGGMGLDDMLSGFGSDEQQGLHQMVLSMFGDGMDAAGGFNAFNYGFFTDKAADDGEGLLEALEPVDDSNNTTVALEGVAAKDGEVEGSDKVSDGTHMLIAAGLQPEQLAAVGGELGMDEHAPVRQVGVPGAVATMMPTSESDQIMAKFANLDLGSGFF